LNAVRVRGRIWPDIAYFVLDTRVDDGRVKGEVRSRCIALY